MATIAEQIAGLEVELTAVKAAQLAGYSGNQSEAMDGMSWTRRSLESLRDRRVELEKSIQRLKRGGRGITVDLSFGTGVE